MYAVITYAQAKRNLMIFRNKGLRMFRILTWKVKVSRVNIQIFKMANI